MALPNALAKSEVLYGAETWILTNKVKEKLDSFGRKCLRAILQQRDIEKEELRRLTSQPELSRITATRVVRWLGHNVRMEESRLTRQVYRWRPLERKNIKRPTWEGEAMEEARRLGVRRHKTEDIYEQARDREQWRKIHQSVRASTIMIGRIAEKQKRFN